MRLSYPLNWFVGWAIVILSIAAFIVSIVLVTRGQSDMDRCIAHGGSWTHTLVVPPNYRSDERGYGNDPQFNDTCKVK